MKPGKLKGILIINYLFIIIGTLPVSAQSLPNKSFGAIHPENIKWMPFPAFGQAAQLAVIVGNPTLPAPYVVRVKVGADMKLPPHLHPEDRIYTVISGVFYIGLGKTFDSTKLVAYPPGSVIVLPGNTPHFHWAKSGEYITQVYGMGPLGITYIDPANDPRNNK
ncbi:MULTISPECIES: cupin domain-containing protein [Niastella]|uniref:Cupin domain-containing protein n=1 Tax=Niastella soli TaxID=2821487 RepID=A0ABS3YWY5_9BACT|nr:cupin domain-containing protein [Niastella soli]MBO9202442.1 cupin domain-containing protein [Niastella soli]